jgi:hypothetical protein
MKPLKPTGRSLIMIANCKEMLKQYAYGHEWQGESSRKVLWATTTRLRRNSA